MQNLYENIRKFVELHSFKYSIQELIIFYKLDAVNTSFRTEYSFGIYATVDLPGTIYWCTPLYHMLYNMFVFDIYCILPLWFLSSQALELFCYHIAIKTKLGISYPGHLLPIRINLNSSVDK